MERQPACSWRITSILNWGENFWQNRWLRVRQIFFGKYDKYPALCRCAPLSPACSRSSKKKEGRGRSEYLHPSRGISKNADDYSYRSDSIGSRFAAFHAGTPEHNADHGTEDDCNYFISNAVKSKNGVEELPRWYSMA